MFDLKELAGKNDTYSSSGNSLRSYSMLWLEGSDTDLSVSLSCQRPLVDVGRAADEVVVVHHHQLGVHVHRVAERVSGNSGASARSRVFKTVRNVFRRFTFAQTVE